MMTPGIISLISNEDDNDVKFSNINGEILDKFISKVLPSLNNLEKKDDTVKSFDLYSSVSKAFNSEKNVEYVIGAVNEFDNMMAEIQEGNRRSR